MKIKLDFVKSTKGTHVYGTTDKAAAIQSIYIKKEGMPTATPAISITIEPEG